MSDPVSTPNSGTLWTCDRQPTAIETGIVRGNLWLVTTTGDVYMCTDDTEDNLQWAYL